MIQENYLRPCAGENTLPSDTDDSLSSQECCAAAAEVLAWGDILTSESLTCNGDVDFMNSALMMAATLPSALVAQCELKLLNCSETQLVTGRQVPCRTLRCQAPVAFQGAHPLHWAAVGDLTRQHGLPRERVCGELIRLRRLSGQHVLLKAKDDPKKAPRELAVRMKKVTSSLERASSKASETAAWEALLPSRMAAALNSALASGELASALASMVADKAAVAAEDVRYRQEISKLASTLDAALASGELAAALTKVVEAAVERTPDGMEVAEAEAGEELGAESDDAMEIDGEVSPAPTVCDEPEEALDDEPAAKRAKGEFQTSEAGNTVSEEPGRAEKETHIEEPSAKKAKGDVQASEASTDQRESRARSS